MSDYTTNATVVLDVNGTKATEAINEQKKRVGELEKAYAKALNAGDSKSLKKVESELKKARRELKSMQTDSANVADVLRRLDKATPKELKSTLKTLYAQLNKMERGTKEWLDQTKKIKSVKAELNRVNSELREQGSLWQRINNTINNWGTTIVAAAGAVTGLVLSARKAVESYAAMEQEMANVRKYTGMTAEQVQDLNEEFKKMDTRTSREGLNQLAQEAGRLGKTSKEDILGFVRASDQINVALDDLGEGATLTLSKLTGIFGDEQRLGTEKALLSVGSVINDLSQNCTASAPYLAEFASRMGGVGSQAGLTIPQIMAFGAVLDSNNQKVEASATAVSQVITRLYQDPAKYAKSAGLDVKAFSTLVKTDMNQALITLLERLNSLGNMDVLAPIFKDMGENGSRAISALSTLAGKIEEVKTQQDVAAQSYAEATSITKEYNVQNNTVQAGLDKAKKRFAELSIELGEKLLPLMKYTITTSSAIVRVLSVLVTFVTENWRTLVTLTSAIVAYNIAVNASVIKTKLLATWQGIVKVATVAWTVVTKLAASAVYLLSGNIAKATVAFKALSTAIKMNPIGLLASGITAVVAGLSLFIGKIRDAGKETERIRKEQEAYKRSLTDISQAMADAAATEKNKLDQLYKTATKETESKDKRIEAANRLKEMYPDYFEKLSTEAIMIGQAKTKYDELTASIIATARAKAAEGKIIEHQTAILALEEQLRTQKSVVAQAQQDYNAAIADENSKNKIIQNTSTSYGPGGYVGNYVSTSDDELDELNDAKTKLSNIESEIAAREEAILTLQKKFGEAISELPDINPDPVITSPESTNKFEKEDLWREEQNLKNRIAYATGTEDYAKYIAEQDRIEKEYYERCLERTDLTNNERLQKEAEFAELKNKEVTRSIEEENRRYNEAVAFEKQRYIDGKTSLESHNNTLALMELGHKRNLVNCTKEGTKERLDAEKAYSDALLADQLSRHNEYLKNQEKHEKELAKIKSSIFGMSDQEKLAAYEIDLANLTEVYDREVKAAGNHKDRLLEIEEAFQIAKLALKQKYDQQINSADLTARQKMQMAAQKQLEWFNSEQGKAFTGSVDFAASTISSMTSALSSLVQAEADKEIASIEEKYDAEIAAAGDNSAKVAELEKKKEEEIAKVKSEASEKSYKMQVFQATAQMIQGALNAYTSTLAIPLIGPILAPAAAAVALAAGMIQIAALKKQQQAAEAQGYAEGGYTKKGGKYEPAGIVHAGEWVASQKLLADPTAKAMIERLDYAQRTNTIGSLSQSAVSRTITAPAEMVASATQESVTRTLAAQTVALNNFNSSMATLNTRLNEPFVTVNTVTGDNGIKKAQDEYDKLIKNKTRK